MVLPSNVQNDRVICQGWVHKKRWAAFPSLGYHCRWFVLRVNGILRYYKHPNAPKHNELRVHSVLDLDLGSNRPRNDVRVQSDRGEFFDLRFYTLDDYFQWDNALRACLTDADARANRVFNSFVRHPDGTHLPVVSNNNKGRNLSRQYSTAPVAHASVCTLNDSSQATLLDVNSPGGKPQPPKQHLEHFTPKPSGTSPEPTGQINSLLLDRPVKGSLGSRGASSNRVNMMNSDPSHTWSPESPRGGYVTSPVESGILDGRLPRRTSSTGNRNEERIDFPKASARNFDVFVPEQNRSRHYPERSPSGSSQGKSKILRPTYHEG